MQGLALFEYAFANRAICTHEFKIKFREEQEVKLVPEIH